MSEDLTTLELIGPGSNTRVVVYVNANNSIDGVVSLRRNLIFLEANVRSLTERRFFLEEADLVPAALTRYGVGSSLVELGVYLVMTLQVEQSVVELLGFTSSPRQYEEELRRLLQSVAIDSPEAS